MTVGGGARDSSASEGEEKGSAGGPCTSKVRRAGRERELGLARTHVSKGVQGSFLGVWRGSGQFQRRLEVVREQEPRLQTYLGRFGRKQMKTAKAVTTGAAGPGETTRACLRASPVSGMFFGVE